MDNGKRNEGLLETRRQTPHPATRLRDDYSLCRLCLKRNPGPVRPRQRRPPTAEARCDICRGLMPQLDSITAKIIAASGRYDFKTFLIGAVLPTQIYEREDALRALLKIRGIENVKGQFTRELGMRLARSTGRIVDYQRPDLTISITVDKENSVSIAMRSRPLMFLGNYTKKVRGFAQKHQRCRHCEGRGCETCELTGLEKGDDSVESVVSRALVSRTGGQVPRYSWIGSEDRDSLVLGRGRPFYVRVFDPKKRALLRQLHVRGAGIYAKLSLVDDSEEQIEAQIRFAVRTRIIIRAERPVLRQDLIRLQQSLAGKEVSLENKGRMVTKKVYAARATKAQSKDNSEFMLVIDADGGLSIKQFVGGEQYSKPSVSEIIGAKCHCVNFDILAVTFLSDADKLSFA
ncbi:MAG: hypothetical protein ABI361_07335 [Nitrososphaera sp.]